MSLFQIQCIWFLCHLSYPFFPSYILADTVSSQDKCNTVDTADKCYKKEYNKLWLMQVYLTGSDGPMLFEPSMVDECCLKYAGR